MSKKLAAPITPIIPAPVVDILIDLLAGDDTVEGVLDMDATYEAIDDAAEDLHALAPNTWQDVIDFAEREVIDGRDKDGEGFRLAGDTQAGWTLSRPTTWNIAVFAIADRNGEGFYVNVDEITKSRYVHTRLMAEFWDADSAMLAVDMLTRYINRWLGDTAR